MSVCVQAAMQFDVDSLEPFLVRVAELIPGGFGEREIAQVVGTAEGMKRTADDELMFQIEFADLPARLRILIQRDEGEGWDLCFFAPRALAECIETEFRLMGALGN